MKTYQNLLIVGTAALLSFSSIGRADSTAFVTLYNQYNTDGNWNIGTQFTVGSNSLSVTALGGYLDGFDADNSNVTTEPITVNLYDITTNSLMTSVVVPTGTTGDSQDFAYLHLALPITLVSGDTYAVTDFVGLADLTNDANNGNSDTFDTPVFWVYNGMGQQLANNPDLTSLTKVQSKSNNPDIIPTHNPNLTSDLFLGGNFQYTVAPEPSTWALMLAGLAGLAFVGRRRLKA